MSDFQLVQTILDQSHLSPLAKSVQPVHSEYDHTLRVYPLPTAVCRTWHFGLVGWFTWTN